MMTNHNILRRVINASPKTTQWVTPISKNLEVCTLDEFFATMELHESRVTRLESKGEECENGNIALVVQKESKWDSSLDDNQEAYMVRKIKKFLRTKYFIIRRLTQFECLHLKIMNFKILFKFFMQIF